MMDNHNYYSGLATALHQLGHTPEQVKTACVQRGASDPYADALIKEAFFGAIGRGLVAGGKYIGKALGKSAPSSIRALPKGVTSSAVGVTQKGAPSIMQGPGAMKAMSQGPQAKWMQNALKSESGLVRGGAGLLQRAGGAVGGAMKGIGNPGGLIQRGQGAVSGAMQGMRTAPGATLWGGAKNFGKGLMFAPGAKGIGGAIGKGSSVYSIGSMLAPRGTPKAPQMQQQQQQRYY